MDFLENHKEVYTTNQTDDHDDTYATNDNPLYDLLTPISPDHTIFSVGLNASSSGHDTIDMDPPNSELDPMLNLGANFYPYLYAKVQQPAQHYVRSACIHDIPFKSTARPETCLPQMWTPNQLLKKSWDSDEEDLERERLVHAERIIPLWPGVSRSVRAQSILCAIAQAIIEHVRRSISMGHDFIRQVFRSRYPGGIYIEACGMSPDNHILAAYFRSIDGFRYENIKSALPKYSLAHGVFLNCPSSCTRSTKRAARWKLGIDQKRVYIGRMSELSYAMRLIKHGALNVSSWCYPGSSSLHWSNANIHKSDKTSSTTSQDTIGVLIARAVS
ncbi:hypothetical protein BT96DRAFT_1005407 [Gymnopus androsaceus JB14]|uniref:Uncharacterized protein n=1 Tax=Gymnopus androsaceus JB14 TaxID=1447944 RepID=A0A6A4GNJ4_9AGAR|nr:hypothetical protein BT96DRAFT_1005407 [Gymnopus androsaceus JB14]